MSWNEKLQCEWLMWIVDGGRDLILMVPHGHRPDMTGCVLLATALMPEVRAVRVFDKADLKALVAHYRLQAGKWVARPVGGHNE